MVKGIPDAIAMRELKYGAKTQAAHQIALADEFLREGRVAEAVDLLLLASDDDGVKSIRARAATEGRPVWLVMIERTGATISRDEWKACGDAAFRDERWREAFRALTMAGDEEGLARVQDKIPGYEIYVPQGK